MPEINVQHERRRTGAREERGVIAGEMRAAGTFDLAAGTFDLNGLSAIQFGESQNPGSTIIGSVSNPNTRNNSAHVETVLSHGGSRTGNVGSITGGGTVQAGYRVYGF